MFCSAEKNSHFIAFLVASDDGITIVTAETNLGNILETWGHTIPRGKCVFSFTINDLDLTKNYYPEFCLSVNTSRYLDRIENQFAHHNMFSPPWATSWYDDWTRKPEQVHHH